MHPKYRPHRRACPWTKWPCPSRCDQWQLGLVGPAELTEPQALLHEQAVRQARRRAQSIVTFAAAIGGGYVSLADCPRGR